MVSSDLASASFAARYFDGRHLAADVARVAFRGDQVEIARTGGTAVERCRFADVVVAEPLSHAPRLLQLPGDAMLQIDDSPDLARALAAAGYREPAVVGLQRAWPASLVALVLLVAGSAWLYLSGLPIASDWAARHVSPSLEARMGDQVLAALDRRVLLPSALPAARRDALVGKFVAFQRAAGLAPARAFVFRSVASGSTVNAFALPGGTIVFLDGIVGLAGDDEEILLAVLAHESGHQELHHMTRGLFRALGGGALAGLLWGDYSSVASHAAILFGQLRYSREDEAEADTFAIAALRRAHISPGAIARFFWKEDALAKKAGRVGLEWLSTHPGSKDRAETALEAAEADRDAAASAASAAPR
jgi:predicted Zn-dependent protease